MNITTETSPLQLANLPAELPEILSEAPSVFLPSTRAELVSLALGGNGADEFDVAYDVPGRGRVVEVNVVRCKNAVAVNYPEPYMRRRDPNCMVIADDGPTDKPRYADRFEVPFDELRGEIIAWLKQQELVLVPFRAGDSELGYDSLMVGPANASFFAAGLGDLQGLITADRLPRNFRPEAVIYLAPPFRHTHCDGKQVVIHNRQDNLHEVFSLNLYPGPSAKKGVYGMLLNFGEKQSYVTLHGSTVEVVTPYDNFVTIMHEGASGGGKSEMLEYPHREADGRLLLGRNVVSGEERWLTLNQGCKLNPVTDDMALCHPDLQARRKKLRITDAEEAWFVRVDHINSYGIDAHLERLCICPPEPLVMLNLEGVPRSTCLIWDHTMDEPGKPCPNPRVILPRRMIPNVVNKPVEVDVRSFGVRTPPCTRENPSYGIMGIMHALPPALAWLWRLVSPRGHANPSITDTEGMTSEGVGSYWPFATGRRVTQANLLLRQILATPRTKFVLMPNQHIGSWKCGFMPQWLGREYLARRSGANFRPEQLSPARCPLLGYALFFMQIEGTQIPHWFLEVDKQPEVGTDGYDAGAEILETFFRQQLKPIYDDAKLDPLGRRIIECCFDGEDITAYEELV